MQFNFASASSNKLNCQKIKINQSKNFRSKILSSPAMNPIISPVSGRNHPKINLHFWTMCNLFPTILLSLNRGCFTFHFYVIAAESWVCVPLTRQPQNPTPRILTSKTPHPYHTPTPKLYKIPTQFNKPLRYPLRHTIKISLNHNIK